MTTPRRAVPLALALALASAYAPARAGDACADCVYRGRLEALFVAPRALGPGWETVEEMPEDVTGDAELRSAGVVAIRALHYTLAVPGGARVCSGELWAFARAAQAREASRGNERAGWRITVLGNLWVTVRGVQMQRGGPFAPGLLPECHRLGELLDARASERLDATREP